MSGRHTQARLVANEILITLNGTQKCYHAVGIEGMLSAVAITGVCGDDLDAISAADARRLAACWNAFEGMSTDDIESMGRFVQFKDEPLGELAQLRDETAEQARALLALNGVLLAKGGAQ